MRDDPILEPGPPGPPTSPPPSAWRTLNAVLLWVGLGIYGLLVWLDLPPPAGTQYAPPPRGAGRAAAHWWDKAQALRGWSVFPEGWAWPLVDPAPLARWLLLLALGGLGAIGLALAERRAARQPGATPWGALAGLVGLGYALQLATLWLKQANAVQLLLDRIVNPGFTGFYTFALQAPGLSTFFGGYAPAIAIPGACGHCRTHPPGPMLAYWLPLQALEHLPAAWQQGLSQTLVALGGLTPPPGPPSATALALLAAHAILLGAAAIVLPLYGLARRLAGPALALRLAALGLMLPGLLLMSPEFDQLYATFAAGLFYVALCGLAARRHPGRWGAAAGLCFAGCLYWSFGLALLAVPLGTLAWVQGRPARALDPAPAQEGAHTVGLRLRQQWGRLPWPWLIGLGIGAAAPWALLWALGLDLPRVVQITSQAHLQGITSYRPYAPWLVFNLVDFAQFAGLPLVLASLVTLGGRGPRGRWLNPYGGLFWAIVLVEDLSGTARAETGRLWVFLLPLALLGLYSAVGQGRLRGPQITMLLAAQFAVCVLLGGRWLTP
ncbi:MAG TPA: hypothetical protein VKY74_07865 [Chloroflexia bacterium]|nr:hypothetical protein [Chloroflexia bacterium]